MKNATFALQLFMEYLQIEKNYSQYTIACYRRDIEQFFQFMNEEGINELDQVAYSDVRLYLTKLYGQHLASRSVARKISSLRSFYKFLMREGRAAENPFALATLPKKEQKIPNFLYPKELEALFLVNDENTALGQRNAALLELLYATGARLVNVVTYSCLMSILLRKLCSFTAKETSSATFRLAVRPAKRLNGIFMGADAS